MATKELQTRIALKYDSYSNWTNENLGEGKGALLKLLPGEIGICEIPAVNGATNVAPTVLFKVGAYKKDESGNNTTELHTFKELPWASAKAADVYGWAKASDVVLEDKTIKFIGTNKTIALNYVTEAEVTELKTKLAAVESLVGVNNTNGNIASRVTAVEGKLNGIDSTVSAAIADSASATEAAYKAYADKVETDAVASAKVYTDKVKNAQATVDGAQNELIQKNADDIAAETLARQQADTAINEKLGAAYTSTNTVAMAISTAEQAAKTHADNAIAALSKDGGAINKNAVDIASNAQNISTEAQTRKDADDAIIGRIVRVEAFFNAADGWEDGHTGLDTALDTLREIQDYLNGEEGAATGGLLDRVATAEDAIDDLKETVGGLTTDLAATTSTANTVKDIVDGFSGKGKIKEITDDLREDLSTVDADLKVTMQTLERVEDSVERDHASLTTNITDVAKLKTDLAEVKADYLKAADFFFINCGSSTELVDPVN